MTTFKNPSNGYTVEVGFQASLAVFFLGPLYLAIKGLWGHVFIWLAIVGIPAALTGGVALVLAVPLMSIIYAIAIQSILGSKYLAAGWEPTLDGTDPFSAPPIVLTPPPRDETKKCPFCAEIIKVEAIRCKHCQADLTGQ